MVIEQRVCVQELPEKREGKGDLSTPFPMLPLHLPVSKPILVVAFGVGGAARVCGGSLLVASMLPPPAA